jgi:hypothetical protein
LTHKSTDARLIKVLSREIAPFDLESTLAHVGGLLTVPDLASAAIRIEALADLALRHCAGRKVPDTTIFRRWINVLLGQHTMARLEDPLEDVFVSNICTPIGSFRIFEGTWESNDGYLQDLIDALLQIRHGFDLSQLLSEIGALLCLSDTVCKRRSLRRWDVGSQLAPHREAIPRSLDMTPLRECTVFNSTDLAHLHITPELLGVFCAQEFGSDPDQAPAPLLERTPLVRFENRYVLVLPSAVSAALRNRILSFAAKCGALEALESALCKLQFSHVMDVLTQEGRAAFDPGLTGAIQATEPQAIPVTEAVLQFDGRHLAHVICIHDSLEDARRCRVGGADHLTSAQLHDLSSHIEATIDHLATKSPEIGISIVIPCGTGRARSLLAPRASSSWFICHDSLYNICALFRDEEWDFVRTWRLLAQVRYIEESGATIVIPHGILTLAAYWIDMNFSLVPREVLFPPDQTLRLAIAPSYALLFRSRSRSAQDIHAAPIDGDKRFLTVRRLFSKAHFSAIGNLPAYVAQSHLSYGVLLGVVECFPSTVWLRWGRPDAEPNLDFPMYAIWEATIVWLARLLDVVSPLLTMPKQPLTIELALSADCFESALDRDFLARHDGSSPISATAIGYGHYRLELLGGFFALAARPENDAERALMRAIFHMIEMAFAIQGGAVWPHTEEILDQVFEDRHARQFHLFAEQYPGEPHSSTGSNPEFVPPEEIARCKLGLAWSDKYLVQFRNSDTQRVACQSEELGQSIKNLVASIWLQLRDGLEPLDRAAVVTQLLEDLVDLECDRRLWRRTSRALSTLAGVRGEAAAKAAQRASMRSLTTVASRTLIEMAVCECRRNDGANPSRILLGGLVARTATLHEFAEEASGLRGLEQEIQVHFHSNGFFDVDIPWFDEIMHPYSRHNVNSQWQDAIARYEDDLIASPDERPPGEVDAASSAQAAANRPVDPKLETAFVAEYGVSPERLAAAFATLQEWAVERQTQVFVVQCGELFRRWQMDLQITRIEFHSMMRALALPPKEQWDMTPSGFCDADWHPWRMRRRLSLVARPMVLLDASVPADASTNWESRIAISPTQCIASFGYLMEGIDMGWFSPGFARSRELKRFLGHAADRRGTEFNDLVAERFLNCGWQARPEINMTQLGGTKELGDVDVLAWSTTHGVLYCVECKSLRPARTAGEVLDQIGEFRGEAKDRLGRHLMRMDWIRNHVDAVSHAVGVDLSTFRVEVLFVTSTLVPMQFAGNLPIPAERFVPISELQQFLHESVR